MIAFLEMHVSGFGRLVNIAMRSPWSHALCSRHNINEFDQSFTTQYQKVK